MKIGFDYWQVISHYPNQIAHLMFGSQALGGDEIHVISAIGKGRAGTIRQEVERAFENSDYMVDEDTYEVHEVVFNNPKQSPELKLAKCKELGIELFFDDRDDVCRLLTANGILAMRVTRKDNSKYDLESEQL
jgi:acid phosphatase class B